MISEVPVEAADSSASRMSVDDGVVVELAAGHVDGDVEDVAPRVPLGRLLARPAEHPAADVVDLAGLFEDRDELVGFDVAERRVLPAQQRLHPDDAEVVEVVDRLVGETELVVDERRTEVELELHVAA